MSTSLRSLLRNLLPILLVCGSGVPALLALPAASYPQPDPSAEEQTLLELMNRARADPAAEGQLLATVANPAILFNYTWYLVNTAQLINDFASYDPKPPLAMSPALMDCALNHSLDMAASGIQQHDGTDGATFVDRINGTGYQWGALGENIYDWVTDPFFCHAGFNVDWGVPSLDHRVNIMGLTPGAPEFKEVGISYVPTDIAGFGPYVVTEDFAAPADSSVAYVLGVVYADANGNAAYDQDEGLAGVVVQPSVGSYYAVTATAGGFVIPLPTSGSGVMTVTAMGGPLGASRIKTVAWTAGTNVKVDFTTDDAAIQTVNMSVRRATTQTGAGLPGLLTISRVDGDTSAPLSVPLIYGGTAVSGVDYAPLPQRVIIPAGEDSVNLAVHPLGGSDVRKTLFVRIKHRSAYYAVGNGFAWSKVNILPPGE